MATEQSETVVEKTVAYVKDMLGIQPRDRTPDEPQPEYTVPEPTSQDALDPSTYTTKSAGQMSQDASERVGELTMENKTVGVPPDSEDTMLMPPPVREHDLTTDEAMRLEAFNKIVERSRQSTATPEIVDTDTGERTKATEQTDGPRNSAQEALDEIRNASLREEIVDENNPSYNGTIKDAAERMKDDKKLPADSEMQTAVERAKVADRTQEVGRQAEQQSDNR